MSFAKPYKPLADRINEDAEQDRKSMCQAHECPNRWSVAPQHLCSAHAWSDPHEWPQITDQQYRLLAARQNQPKREPGQSRPVTREEMQRARDSLRAFAAGNQADPKLWAKRLKAREMAGERLSDIQRKMWRAALHEHASSHEDS